MPLLWALGASFAVSLISVIGIFTLIFSKRILDEALLLLVGFSAGGLVGSAFLHLLPEAIADSKETTTVFLYVIYGFVAFFFLERYFHWRHCHNGKCDVHTFTYLNLVGDSIHNFSDGLIIGATFMADIQLGIIATLAIIFHEIPQEIGDFGVLVYGGFSRTKALLFNFLTALTAVVGTLVGYYFGFLIEGFSNIVLPLAAGGFIYIAACDLIPEIHKQGNSRKSAFSIVTFIFGIILMYVLKCGHVH